MLNWAKLPAAFIQDRRITLIQFRVYSALLLFHKTAEGYREPTYEELVEWLGMEKASVSAAITGLEKLGWLRREIGGGRGKKSRYWLNSISTEPEVVKVVDLPTLSEPEKVVDLPTLSNEKGCGFTPPLEPERLVICPPFSDGDTIYKRNKAERSKDREKIYPPTPEKIDPPEPEKPAKTRAPIKTTCPANFSLSDGVRDWATKKQIPPAILDQHFEYFVGVAIAKGYVYANWDQAFKNAVNANWAKINLTGVTYDQPRLNGYQPANARISAAERKRIDDEQIEAFLAHGITPGSPKNQPEKDITATAVRID
jgi:hypothetical protein